MSSLHLEAILGVCASTLGHCILEQIIQLGGTNGVSENYSPLTSFNFLFTERETKHFESMLIKTCNLFTPLCEDAQENGTSVLLKKCVFMKKRLLSGSGCIMPHFITSTQPIDFRSNICRHKISHFCRFGDSLSCNSISYDIYKF